MKKLILLFLFAFSTVIFLAACSSNLTTEDMGDAVINGVENVTIGVGQDYSKLTGISATDYDGKDLTSSIIVDGILNAKKPGEYEITYKVKGASGVEVTASRTITVIANAKLEGIENIPDSLLVDTEFNILDYLTAIDYDETDLTQQIVVESDIVNIDGTVDTSNVGVYDITIKVTGTSNYPTIQNISLTIYEKGNVQIFFSDVDEGKSDYVTKPLGTSFDLEMVVNAKDYDGSDVEISSIIYDEELNSYIEGSVFTPNEEGEYLFTYKATGENGIEVSRTLTVNFIKQGLIIDGNYIPVLSNNINNDLKPSNSVLIYTELKGMGEYGVLAIVDSHGRIILARDCFGEQIDINNPIKTGHPEQLRGKANNSQYDWSGADLFKGLLGPQGTPGGIPEGGFAIYFSLNRGQASHPARELGLKYAREFGAKVEVVGLNIPNYQDISDNDAEIKGIEDIEIEKNSTFDPLAGVSASDKDESSLMVEVVFNNVDTTKSITEVTDYKDPTFADGWYSVVYKVTGANNYTVYATRRVNVRAPLVDAVIEGANDVTISVGQELDLLSGIIATDYNGADITDQITIEGNVDNSTPGTYIINYKVTGTNGNEVSVSRTIIVAANARFEGLENKTIYVGSLFDPLSFIKAYDFDNTDITNSIIITGSIVNEDGTIDTSEIGEYELILEVTGSSGNIVEGKIVVSIISLPNAKINFINAIDDRISITLGTELNLLDLVDARDYDFSILIPTITYNEILNNFVTDNIFTPTDIGIYEFTYKVTGLSGVEITKILTVEVVETGINVDGIFIPVKSENINNDLKPRDSVLIYTELKGMGEYGVLVIVDSHGRVVLVRDCYGEQIDINNPIKAGTPTNVKGLPIYKAYDEFTNGLWTNWTKGGADSFEGLLGPQGTPGGIPEGGFAIYFPNGEHRSIGLEYAREFSIKVEVIGLEIPGFNPELGENDPIITGVNDITINEGESFDPLEGISAVDSNGNSLDINIAFNNVDINKPVIPDAPRVVNDLEGRAQYAQGWYSVVYEVTDNDGYTMYVTRRVIVE